MQHPTAGLVGGHRIFVDSILDRILPRERENDPARQVVAAMRAACAGGKRLRPILALCTGDVFKVPKERLAGICACVEMFHAASIIFDDLPSMDDAVLRRGAAPIHRAFDEATAILAANSLITLGFDSLVHHSPGAAPETLLLLVSDAARAVGHEGMSGGQHADLTRLRRKNPSKKSVEFVHEHKTGRLFELAAHGAARLGNATDDECTQILTFARNLGIAFQLGDDFLAATRTREELGKESRTDTGKAMLGTPFERAWAQAAIQRFTDTAEAALAPFGEQASSLKSIIQLTRERSRA